ARGLRGVCRRRPRARLPACGSGAARALLLPCEAANRGDGRPGRVRGAGRVLMQYVPILMVLAISLGVACLLPYPPALRGPRRVTRIKMDTFECGKDILARPEGRFAIKFSTTAIFFIIFDIELMFVFPWTVVYRSLGFYGFVSMVVYLGILML